MTASTSRANSVRNLQNLYTIVIGLSLGMGVFTLARSATGPVPLRLDLLPYFWAFVVTLIPFYHGALRHLDQTYIERGGRLVREGALLADFVLLFLEGCIFMLLALMLEHPQYFAWGVVLLLALDTVWSFFAHLAFTVKVPGEDPHGWKPETVWGLINIVTVFVLIIVFYALDLRAPEVGPADSWLGLAMAVVCTLRSGVDYSYGWSFYYPPE